MKKDSRNGDEYSSFCKECHKQASIDWQKRNPGKVNETRKARYHRIPANVRSQKRKLGYNPEAARIRNLRKLYKVTPEWFDATLAAQGGVCAICSTPAATASRTFHIDHDHACCPTTLTCGKCIRGLLCHACNTTLSSLERTPRWVEHASAYLAKHPSNEQPV